MRKQRREGSVSFIVAIVYDMMLRSVALITISTRASLKRYHSFTLTLGLGDSGEEWEFQRIGTQAEKSSEEKELKELSERLANVDQWIKRRQEIEDKLNKVWMHDGDELAPPPYVEKSHKQEDTQAAELGQGSDMPEDAVLVEKGSSSARRSDTANNDVEDKQQ